MGHIDRRVAIDNDNILVNGEPLAVSFAEINATASGITEIVAAVPAKQIRVVLMFFTTDTQVSIGWKSGTTYLIHPQAYAQFGGAFANPMPSGYLMQTVAGEALNIELSVTAAVRGMILYALI